ncbi:MAG TPA: Hsp20/alpha crystallin family protein, partial [Anaerolineae bacterium]
MSRIVRWNPFREMMDLRSEFDRLFEETLSGPRSRWQPTSWGMDLDVAENEDNFVITASLPGMKPEDIDVSLTNNVLTIRGETK